MSTQLSQSLQTRIAAISLLLALAGCTSPGGGLGTPGANLSSSSTAANLSAPADSSTVDSGPQAPPDLGGYGAPVTLSATATNKIDVLFMVDNSPSMTAMQDQLQAQFAKFLQPFVDLAAAGFYADLHIGVVTSDYGAGDTPGGGCSASPGGQNGLLQAIGAAAPAGCAAPVGSPYIGYQFGAAGDQSNLPGSTSPTQLAATFSCMAAVGAGGCGFEHQLESVNVALHNQVENAGFLRDDALLAVVFFTNEDDGSAPPTVKFYESTADTVTYGAYDTYRQTRFGVVCVQGGMLAMSPEAASGAPLMGCEAAPDSPPFFMPGEYDISRYTNLFTQPLAKGGLKGDPSKVVLVAIDAPETPFQTVTVQTGTGLGVAPNPTYVPCTPLSNTCVVRVDHSCQNSVQPAFFGDPAVRLNSVVRAAKFNQISSICGDDATATPDYTQVLSKTGDLLRSRLLGNCMPTKLTNPTAPDCLVLAESATSSGGTTQTPIPRCDQGGDPCWTAVSAPSCAGLSPDDVAIQLTATAPLPAGTTLSASCK